MSGKYSPSVAPMTAEPLRCAWCGRQDVTLLRAGVGVNSGKPAYACTECSGQRRALFGRRDRRRGKR